MLKFLLISHRAPTPIAACHSKFFREIFWISEHVEYGAIFENRPFSGKILEISKCSSSVNLKDRRILNPFLESLDPWFSDAHADREDLISENFQKCSNVKKVKIEDFDIYMSSVFNVLRALIDGVKYFWTFRHSMNCYFLANQELFLLKFC